MEALTLAAPLVVAPASQTSPVLSQLDRLLHPDRLKADHEEIRKARVLAGTVALLVVTSWPAIAAVLAERPPVAVAAMLLGALGCYHLALARLRYSTDPLGRIALVACLPVLLNFVFLAIHRGGSAFVTDPWNIAIGLFVTYFIGERGGFAVSAFLCFELAASWGLDRLGLSLPAMPRGDGVALAFADALGVMAISAIGWLYALSRVEAHRALDDALTRVAGSEARLMTLVENTDDVIASFDVDGRLMIANAPYRRLFTLHAGRAPVVGVEIITQLRGAYATQWREYASRVMGGARVAFESSFGAGEAQMHMEFSMSPIPEQGGGLAGFTLFGRDISARKAAEEKLQGMHRQLMDLSRQAGMAEVATGILHNVGNTLNSVNVSVSLASEQLKRSKVANLAKVAVMLREHEHDVAAFLSADPKGKLVPGYVTQLSDVLNTERESLQSELAELATKVDHIKSVVRLQQEHASGGGFVEVVPVRGMIESALRLHDESFSRLGIELKSECADVPSLTTDRHKLLQILVNLLANGRHALMDSGRPDKRLAISVDLPTPDRVRIRVMDNGVGILPENKPKMFRQGFTTRKEGHGFGLHMSALNAVSMGGTLTCDSPGANEGATFTLELPVRAG